MNDYWIEETCDCLITIESGDVIVGKAMFAIHRDEVLVATVDEELFMALDSCSMFMAKISVNKMVENGWVIERTSNAWQRVVNSAPTDDDIRNVARNLVERSNPR